MEEGGSEGPLFPHIIKGILLITSKMPLMIWGKVLSSLLNKPPFSEKTSKNGNLFSEPNDLLAYMRFLIQ